MKPPGAAPSTARQNIDIYFNFIGSYYPAL